MSDRPKVSVIIPTKNRKAALEETIRSLLAQTRIADEKSQSDIPTFAEARDNSAKQYLIANLQMTQGNVSKAARLAKRNRTDFYKLLARYRLQPEDFKDTRI